MGVCVSASIAALESPLPGRGPDSLLRSSKEDILNLHSEFNIGNVQSSVRSPQASHHICACAGQAF